MMTQFPENIIENWYNVRFYATQFNIISFNLRMHTLKSIHIICFMKLTTGYVFHGISQACAYIIRGVTSKLFMEIVEIQNMINIKADSAAG